MASMKAPFKWDYNSDQPYQLKDRAYKKMMRKQNMGSLIKTVLVSLAILPAAILSMPFVRPASKFNTSKFFALGVNIDKDDENSLKEISALGVRNLIIRFPLWEMERLEEYRQFVAQFKDQHILLNVLQDRENIEDLELFEKNITKVFETFSSQVDEFQIGSTINRAKWGFFSVEEYMKFYQVAYKVRNKKFSALRLVGSGVIDFEFHFTMHTLFNSFKVHYDALAALLYVDRRGAPENTQLGFGLSDKISLLGAITRLSKKSSNDIYITETNWPLKGTAPYAPTSEHECVSEEEYANYMLRYYLLAFASQQINRLYWHQLIAPGYGLIDNREGLRHMPAFKTYKFMLKMLQDSQFLRLDIKRDYYHLQVLKNNNLIQVHWCLSQKEVEIEKGVRAFSKDGKILKSEKLNIGPSPIYIQREQ